MEKGNIMPTLDRNASVIRVWCLSALCLIWSACASGNARQSPVAVSPPGTQEEAADLARDSRSQANTLAEMADRRELEAAVLARELGQDHPSVETKRRLAQELRTAAAEADQNARDLRRTVPHGMVQ